MHPLKKMFLFAWSWSTNIIYSKVNHKIFVRPCWFPLNTFDVPVTKSPTAVAVQDYTQLNDSAFSYFICIIIMLTELYNGTWFNLFWNFALSCFIVFCTLFLVFTVVVVVVFLLLEKVRLRNVYSQKWYPWWRNNCEMK